MKTARTAAIWSTLLLLCISCVSAGQVGDPDSADRFRAENSLMKKRLTLIERENDIFKQENNQFRLKNQQLQAKVEKLEFDLAALNEKYDVDLTAKENAIHALEDNLTALRNSYEGQIRSMTELNQAIQEKLGKQVAELSEQVALQKKAFSSEKEKIMQESAKREFVLSEKIDVLDKEDEAKSHEIAALKNALAENQSKFNELSARLEKTLKTLARAEEEIQRLKPKTNSSSPPAEKSNN